MPRKGIRSYKHNDLAIFHCDEVGMGVIVIISPPLKIYIADFPMTTEFTHNIYV